MPAEQKDSWLRKGDFAPYVDTVVPTIAARDALLIYNPTYPSFFGTAYGMMKVSVASTDKEYKLSQDRTTWTETATGTTTVINSVPTRIIYGGGIIPNPDDPFAFNVDPTLWQIDYLQSSFISFPFSINPLADITLARYDRPILTKQDDPVNPGTLIILEGVESNNPVVPDYNPSLYITLDIIRVTVDGASVIHPDIFGVYRSDNRKYVSGIYIDDTLTELLARPIPSAELTFTYLEDNGPITWELIYDDTFMVFKIVPQLDLGHFWTIDGTLPNTADVVSGFNSITVNGDGSFAGKKRFILTSDYLAGGSHYLPPSIPNTFNVDQEYRYSGTSYNFVGGMNITDASNGTRFYSAPHLTNSNQYYVNKSIINGISRVFVTEFSVVTKKYTTYSTPGIVDFLYISSIVWVGEELYIPGDNNNVYVFDNIAKTFGTYTIVNPHLNATSRLRFGYSDGTYVWWVGLGGTPEPARNCVCNINISSKVFTWIFSVDNTYINYFADSSFYYLIRNPGFSGISNELERYNFSATTNEGGVSIIPGNPASYYSLMLDSIQIPIVSATATAFYINSTDLVRVVMGNLAAATIASITFTPTTYAGDNPASVHYSGTSAYVVCTDGAIRIFDLSSGTNTKTTSVIIKDGSDTTPLRDAFLNTNTSLLYVSSYEWMYIIDVSSIPTQVGQVYTGNFIDNDINVNGAKSVGNRSVFIYKDVFPTTFDTTKWLADINRWETTPFDPIEYGTESGKGDNASFIYEFDNYKERFDTLYAPIGTTGGTGFLTTGTNIVSASFGLFSPNNVGSTTPSSFVTLTDAAINLSSSTSSDSVTTSLTSPVLYLRYQDFFAVPGKYTTLQLDANGILVDASIDLPSTTVDTAFFGIKYKYQYLTYATANAVTTYDRYVPDIKYIKDAIAGGGGGGTTFSDSTFRIQDNGDATKQVAFEVSGVATATTRTLTVANVNGNLVTSTSVLNGGRVALTSSNNQISDSVNLIFNTTSNGMLGIGASPSSRFTIDGATSTNNQALLGMGIAYKATTFTDQNTIASGTVAHNATHGLGAPTLIASNTGVTYTIASTLYVAAPIAGTNVTIGTANSIYAAGAIRTDGYLGIANQAAPATPTTSGRIYFDTSNRLSWKGTNGFTRTFDGTTNTASRIYVLPDQAGTIALLSDIGGVSAQLVLTSIAGANPSIQFNDADLTLPNYSTLGISPTVLATTAGSVAARDPTLGGLSIAGLTAATGSAATNPIHLNAIHGTVSPTTSGIFFSTSKWNGTTASTAIAATEKIAEFANNGTVKVVVMGDGSTFIGGTTTPSSKLHLAAGSATANTAPLQFNSGALETVARAGVVEFLTDAFYGTITTGIVRKTFAFLEGPTFSGTPTLPTGTIGVTQAALNSTTAVATTAFVTTAGNLKANLASPTFTGTVTMPTATTTFDANGLGIGVAPASTTQLNVNKTFTVNTLTTNYVINATNILAPTAAVGTGYAGVGVRGSANLTAAFNTYALVGVYGQGINSSTGNTVTFSAGIQGLAGSSNASGTATITSSIGSYAFNYNGAAGAGVLTSAYAYYGGITKKIGAGTLTGTSSYVFYSEASDAASSIYLYSGISCNIGTFTNNFSFYSEGGANALRGTLAIGLAANTVATAKLQLGAGTTAASTAPLKFNLGVLATVLNTTAEAGALEAHNSALLWTDSTGYRRELSLNDNITYRVIHRYDFLEGSAGGLPSQNANGGTQSNTVDSAQVKGRPGITQLQLNTTAGGQSGLGSKTGITFGDGVCIYEADMLISNISAGADTFLINFGFMDDYTGAIGNGAYFAYTDSVNTGKFQAIVVNNAVATTQDTTITVAAATWYRLRIESNAAGTSLVFKINGTVTNTITTNIPTTAIRSFGFGGVSNRIAGTTSRNVSLDYLYLDITLTTAR